MLESAKRTWAEIRDGTPGERFRDYHRRRRERRGGRGHGLPSLVGGAVLALVGVVLLFIPGPGILLILVGGALMARESRTVAGALDRLEPPTRDLVGRGRRMWRGASGLSRTLAILAAASLAGVLGWLVLSSWLGD